MKVNPSNPTGKWEPFLPIDEVQNLNGIEPYACTLFALLNCVETLIKFQYGEERNYSDRFLAKATDTDRKLGNDPHYVAEYLRKNGVVTQTDWSFDSFIDTFAKFYMPLPAVLRSVATKFIAEFALNHWYVPTDKASLKHALTFSPLAVSVYAWEQNDAGLYITPPGAMPTHCVMLYDFEEGQCWKIFDSYDSTHKKLEWNFPFAIAKRYKLTRQTDIKSRGWSDFLNILWSWWPFGDRPVTIPVIAQGQPGSLSTPKPLNSPIQGLQLTYGPSAHFNIEGCKAHLSAVRRIFSNPRSATSSLLDLLSHSSLRSCWKFTYPNGLSRLNFGNDGGRRITSSRLLCISHSQQRFVLRRGCGQRSRDNVCRGTNWLRRNSWQAKFSQTPA